jgi:hypothetical protein
MGSIPIAIVGFIALLTKIINHLIDSKFNYNNNLRKEAPMKTTRIYIMLVLASATKMFSANGAGVVSGTLSVKLHFI